MKLFFIGMSRTSATNRVRLALDIRAAVLLIGICNTLTAPMA